MFDVLSPQVHEAEGPPAALRLHSPPLPPPVEAEGKRDEGPRTSQSYRGVTVKCSVELETLYVP